MKYLHLILLYFMCYIGISQNTPQFRDYNGNGEYSEVEDFPVKGIASDFGPRNLEQANYHWGIDYNDIEDDYGHLLVATIGGTVHNINKLIRTNNQEAYIVLDVGDYRLIYMHMFYDGSSTTKYMNDNTVILKYMLGNENSNKLGNDLFSRWGHANIRSGGRQGKIWK